jgi:hypothetical protein
MSFNKSNSIANLIIFTDMSISSNQIRKSSCLGFISIYICKDVLANVNLSISCSLQVKAFT